MKKIFAASLALVASLAFGTTLAPVQMLNPAGSSSGQVVASTGPSSAPGWANVSATALTGIVPVANGGTNASSASGTALDNITGFSGTGFLTRTGAGTYAFQSATNGITLANLAQSAANTVLANATGSTANVAAFSMPSCSTSSSALEWASGTGFACNTSVNAATLGSATFAAPGPIGSTTASTGAFTTLSASSTVSGTGFSTYLASPPAIGGTTAAAGKFTTLQATNTFTPATTSGIVGTTLADSANAGSIGEVITASVTSGSAVSLTSGSSGNITSISLSAGDWDVWGQVAFVPSAAPTILGGWVNTTSATQPSYSAPGAAITLNQLTFASAATQVFQTGTARINVSTTTTAYLSALGSFSGTCTAYGYISARRRR